MGNEMSLRPLTGRVRALAERATPFTHESVEKLRKDFLLLMKNVPKVDNYADAENLWNAMKVWNERFDALIFQQLVTSIPATVRERLGEGFADWEAWAKDWSAKIRSACWTFYINFRLPFEQANTEYFRKYNASWTPGQSKEAGESYALTTFLEKRTKWAASVKRYAQPAWKILKEYLDWLSASSKPVTAKIDVPSDENVELEGFKFRIMNGDKLDGGDVFQDVVPRLREALKIYRTRATKTFPWLLKNQLPMELLFQCEWGKWAARYVNAPPIHIEVCAWSCSSAPPDSIAHVLAHEMGHHLFKVYLGNEGRDFWEKAVRRDRGELDLEKLANIWEEKAPTGHLSDLEKHLKHDPVMFLQVETLTHGHGNEGKSHFFSLAELKALIASGTRVLSVPNNPITAYAEKNTEEAFCEAFGMLVGYGQRALLPMVRGWLKIILPEIRVESLQDRVDDLREMFPV